ncbi:MAG TPA: class II aldolase/adducin family protein [Steroidobacteraceae bacterium]|jgi:L-fuculose-phosphate aldolase
MRAPQDAAADEKLRDSIVLGCRELTRRGLTYGKSGNISVRRDDRSFFVSPTGMPYESLAPDDIPRVDSDGRWFGRRRPSSEWRFHRDILKARSEIGAIVHTHSPRATALACTGRGIPAFHYMVAVAGGADIRCAPYHTFGSKELSAAAVEALKDRAACLLANHGVIALGRDLESALSLAGEVEDLAAKYCTALALGEIRILGDVEMERVIDKFRSYGKQEAVDPGLEFGGRVAPEAQVPEG